jgi:hypothetical protein
MFSFPFLPSLWNLAQTFLPCIFKQGIYRPLQEPNPLHFVSWWYANSMLVLRKKL